MRIPVKSMSCIIKQVHLSEWHAEPLRIVAFGVSPKTSSTNDILPFEMDDDIFLRAQQLIQAIQSMRTKDIDEDPYPLVLFRKSGSSVSPVDPSELLSFVRKVLEDALVDQETPST